MNSQNQSAPQSYFVVTESVNGMMAFAFPRAVVSTELAIGRMYRIIHSRVPPNVHSRD